MNPRMPKVNFNRVNLNRGARAAGVLALSIAVLLAGYYVLEINRPRDFGEQVLVIARGDTLGDIAAQLKSRGVIGETFTLRFLARHGDRGAKIRSGEYRFPPDTSLRDFLHRVVTGRGQVGIKVTILEGWTFAQMREELKKRAPKLNPRTAAMSDGEIMAALGHPGLHPEGRFFPDTYYYTAGRDDLSVYRQAFDLMRDKLELAWANRAHDLILPNPDQALIMASIIAKESYIADEQRRIAGVFYNRLKKGMRLQTDPTVIYGLGDAYRGNITRAHLKQDTPYNTYTRGGLTPTPISLPGWDALTAATRPQKTDAYYFVASEGGRHHFSKTLKQHNAAVRKYILKKKRG